MAKHSNFPLTAARDQAACGNGTTVQKASHSAARHKTAAANRASTLVPAVGAVLAAPRL